MGLTHSLTHSLITHSLTSLTHYHSLTHSLTYSLISKTMHLFDCGLLLLHIDNTPEYFVPWGTYNPWNSRRATRDQTKNKPYWAQRRTGIRYCTSTVLWYVRSTPQSFKIILFIEIFSCTNSHDVNNSGDHEEIRYWTDRRRWIRSKSSIDGSSKKYNKYLQRRNKECQ